MQSKFSFCSLPLFHFCFFRWTLLFQTSCFPAEARPPHPKAMAVDPDTLAQRHSHPQPSSRPGQTGQQTSCTDPFSFSLHTAALELPDYTNNQRGDLAISIVYLWSWRKWTWTGNIVCLIFRERKGTVLFRGRWGIVCCMRWSISERREV